MVWVLSFFFVNQKTAYEMRISDWSSDVCSSDLSCMSATGEPSEGFIFSALVLAISRARTACRATSGSGGSWQLANMYSTAESMSVASAATDRKSVVEGKSVSVRVDLGGPRRIKQNKRKTNLIDTYVHYAS